MKTIKLISWALLAVVGVNLTAASLTSSQIADIQRKIAIASRAETGAVASQLVTNASVALQRDVAVQVVRAAINYQREAAYNVFLSIFRAAPGLSEPIAAQVVSTEPKVV